MTLSSTKNSKTKRKRSSPNSIQVQLFLSFGIPTLRTFLAPRPKLSHCKSSPSSANSTSSFRLRNPHRTQKSSPATSRPASQHASNLPNLDVFPRHDSPHESSGVIPSSTFSTRSRNSSISRRWIEQWTSGFVDAEEREEK